MKRHTGLLILACILGAACAPAARAETGYYLVSTYDVEGQASIDYKYWNAHTSGGTVASPEIGIGYGVTSRWYTEIYGQWLRVRDGATRRIETAWQNDFMMTQGQYPFDLALHTKVSKPHGGDGGYSVEWGPVVQTEMGRTQFNANLFFQRDYHQPAGGGEHVTELAYQLAKRQDTQRLVVS